MFLPNVICSQSPRYLLPIILIEPFILLPSRHMDIEKSPILLRRSILHHVNDCLCAGFRGQIGTTPAQVSLEPLVN